MQRESIPYSPDSKEEAKIRLTDESQVSVTPDEIVKNLGMAVITTDDHGTILSFNQKAVGMLGYPPDELIGMRSVIIFYQPDELAEAARKLTLQFNQTVNPDFDVIRLTGDHLNGEPSEWTFKTRNGKDLPVLLSVTRIMGTGEKVKRYILTALDFTEGKNSELSLHKKIEEERELNELKSRFFSAASHEFRSPLASVILSCDSLITYWDQLEPDKVRKKLAGINREVTGLLKTVDDVLQLSRIEGGKIFFNPGQTDIIELCRRSLENFNAGSSLVDKIMFEIPCRLLIMNLDHTMILHAVNNLLSNAVKYSGNNPGIALEIIQNDDEICITVTDNGIGIPEKDQEHLFSPFFRGGNARSYEGTGLGLCIVKEAVRMHGGKVSFRSRLGSGSTFSIHLPSSLIIKSA